MNYLKLLIIFIMILLSFSIFSNEKEETLPQWIPLLTNKKNEIDISGTYSNEANKWTRGSTITNVAPNLTTILWFLTQSKNYNRSTTVVIEHEENIISIKYIDSISNVKQEIKFKESIDYITKSNGIEFILKKKGFSLQNIEAQKFLKIYYF